MLRGAAVNGEGKLEVGCADGCAGGGSCLGSATLRTSEIDGSDCREAGSFSPNPDLFGSDEIILEIAGPAGVGYADECGEW